MIRPSIPDTVKPEADVIDVCCGGRMFWYGDRSDTIYMDIREKDTVLCDGREFSVRPDVVADFRHNPYPDGSFSLVVFDPPHLRYGAGWMAEKYGTLSKNWKADISAGFSECMRILRSGGFLIFKWSECQIPLKEVSPLFPCTPMFGQRHGSRGSIWMVFRKGDRE